MPGNVRVRNGDIFDLPTDLIVLPCATNGMVTNFVASRLEQYTIPFPPYEIVLGEVELRDFTGAENIAQYVAFACSVRGMSSNPEAIRSIGRELGHLTRRNSTICEISAPLLGSGAGGLSSEVVISTLSDGFKSSSQANTTLTINILRREIFDENSRRNTISHDDTETDVRTPPRVFISYSGTSPKHAEWVSSLGAFLRSNGINARLDQWHLRHGMDMPQWMTNELALAERVIIISDARYTDRADGRLGGVGWETMIIQGDMFNLPASSRKYLVIIRDDSFETGIPHYLKTKFCIHWKSDSDEEKLKSNLLKEIYNAPLAPPIGSPPAYYLNR